MLWFLNLVHCNKNLQMDQTVFSLWQQVVSPTYHGEEERRASFLFLDIRGVMGDENAVLPVLKYWVR